FVFTAWVGWRLARLPGAEQPVARSAELDTPGQLLLAVCSFGLLAVTIGGIFFWFACQKPEGFYLFGLLGAGVFAMGTSVLLLIGGPAEPTTAADPARDIGSGSSWVTGAGRAGERGRSASRHTLVRGGV